MEIMAAMEIFNPARCPTSREELVDYGNADLETLIKHYGEEKHVGGKVFAPRIDAEQTRIQWELLKETIFKWSKEKHGDKRCLWKQQLKTGELESLPMMYILVCIMLVFPYNTSCCERGFSLMKLIKSALRNRMYVETLDALMAIKLLGKRYIVDADDEGVETKFFEEVLDDWENARLRNPNRARFNNQNAKKVAETIGQKYQTM
jgi:hypothetical protein